MAAMAAAAAAAPRARRRPRVHTTELEAVASAPTSAPPLATRLDALAAAPPLRVLPVDVLRIADAFATFVEGRLVRAFGSVGEGAGQFGRYSEYGLRVAVGPRGDVLVADGPKHRVMVFRPDGAFVRAWGSRGSGPGQFYILGGLCVSAAGEVFVVDCHRVQVFSAEGAFLRAFGSQGAAPGRLNYPVGVAVSAAGEVFVADMGNDRVCVFRASDGAFLRAFGSTGDPYFNTRHLWDYEGLRRPTGVAVSTAGEVFVAYRGNQRVCMFRGSDGAFLCANGVTHAHKLPLDVAVTAAGELLVTCGWGNPKCFVYRAADCAYLRAFAAVPAGGSGAGVAVGPLGEVVVAGDGGVHVFE